jgi:hemoglobin
VETVNMAISLFEKYGGFAKVRRVVTDFYDKVLEEPELAKYFADTNMRVQIDHQTKFISSVLGGPAAYTDDALRRAHANLGITVDDFNEIVDLICETLEDHDFASNDVETVRGELLKKEGVILGDPPSGRAAAM